jgi:hypothetical protein
MLYICIYIYNTFYNYVYIYMYIYNYKNHVVVAEASAFTLVSTLQGSVIRNFCLSNSTLRTCNPFQNPVGSVHLQKKNNFTSDRKTTLSSITSRR